MAFGRKILIWRFYTIIKVLSITECIQIVNRKKFIIAVLFVDSKIFVIYMAIREQEEMLVYSKKQAQIKVKAQVGTWVKAYIRAQVKASVQALLFDKALTVIKAKSSNYMNVFSAKNISELSDHTGINNHVIKLEEDNQLLYRPIYSLKSMELEILKTYIKTNLANEFICCPFKSPAKVSIFFD